MFFWSGEGRLENDRIGVGIESADDSKDRLSVIASRVCRYLLDAGHELRRGWGLYAFIVLIRGILRSFRHPTRLRVSASEGKNGVSVVLRVHARGNGERETDEENSTRCIHDSRSPGAPRALDFPKQSTQLCPPNPKELEMAAPIAASLASPGI